MIECKAYHATFKTDLTCVANQHKLANMRGRRKGGNGTGNPEILFQAPPADYYRIHLCDGCKIGERLYSKAKREDRLPVRTMGKFQKGNPGRMAVANYRFQNAVRW